MATVDPELWLLVHVGSLDVGEWPLWAQWAWFLALLTEASKNEGGGKIGKVLGDLLEEGWPMRHDSPSLESLFDAEEWDVFDDGREVGETVALLAESFAGGFEEGDLSVFSDSWDWAVEALDMWVSLPGESSLDLAGPLLPLLQEYGRLAGEWDA